MSSLQTAQATNASTYLAVRDQPTQERAHRSFNRRANSSLPYRLMLGANLDMAALRATKRARASGLRQADGRKRPPDCCAEATISRRW